MDQTGSGAARAQDGRRASGRDPQPVTRRYGRALGQVVLGV
ncbi:hypothetical protein P7L78_26365 [Tistrella bauzanensis]